MQVIFRKKLYESRSDIVRELLKEGKYNKSTIAEFADVVPQTVQYLYRKMVERGDINDYYPAYIKARKMARLTRGKRFRR